MKSRPGSRQQDRDLEREHVLAVEVLVQAVVVALAVAQEQRRRPELPGGVAAREERWRASAGKRGVDAASLASQRLAIGARRG